MDQPRSVGRPFRSDGVGHTMILERIRAALRERPRSDLPRRELATYARVSPGLISYYFPDRSSLFAAAAQPVLDRYIVGMRKVLESDHTPLDRFKSLTYLLLDFNFQEGYLLDFYFEYSKRNGNDIVSDRLIDVDRDIIGLFEELQRERTVRGGCAHSLKSALWKMCHRAAYGLRKEAMQGDRDAIIVERAEVIVDYFSNWVSGPLPWQDISSAA